jgi:hypothetical protein
LVSILKALEENMKSTRILLILTTIFILAVFLVACSKSTAVTEPLQNQTVTQQESTTVQETSVPTNEPLGVPEDVPVMPDAYDLQIPNEFTIYYKVALPLQDVVTFYNEELPNYGWQQPKHPDSAVGAMAQMARSKENGDRITFSIQYNPVGEFTVVQISLTRKP